jgi:hypothetical protein
MNTRRTHIQSTAERAQADFQRPAPYPFRIGQTYANRQGKYEVIEIAPPNMTIRYESGALLMADIRILARIWENMQLPPEHAEPEPRQRASGTPAPKARAPTTVSPFRGLSDGDFRPSVSRTTWRARLGQLLAARLSEITGIPHNAFPVGSRPEIYIAREHHFSGKSPEHRARFLFRLTAEVAEYGFYVERDWQGMDRTWDWLRFIAALRKPAAWSAQVETAMRERGLEAEAESSKSRIPDATQKPGPVGRWTMAASGLQWLPAGGSTPASCTWQDMAEALTAAEPRLTCDFYVLGRTKKAEAIALGERLVDRVAQTYAALMPLYDVSAR